MTQYVLTLGASNSRSSINAQLAEYASSLINGFEIKLIDLNDFEMPIFSVDRELIDGYPKEAQLFKTLVKGAAGILISFAEHNGSYTAAFKNIIDWVSRIEGKLWESKPMLLLSTSPGSRGGKTVIELASTTFPFMGGHVVGNMAVPLYHDNVDIKNGIKDPSLQTELLQKIKAFQEIMSEKR